MYSMFSTPLICCSIGVMTVDATTSALAPGYWPETLMIGGAISGYCATGRRENETPPRMTKTIETTAAKIGRSIKKCEMRISGHSRVIEPEEDGRRCRCGVRQAPRIGGSLSDHEQLTRLLLRRRSWPRGRRARQARAH